MPRWQSWWGRRRGRPSPLPRVHAAQTPRGSAPPAPPAAFSLAPAAPPSQCPLPAAQRPVPAGGTAVLHPLPARFFSRTPGSRGSASCAPAPSLPTALACASWDSGVQSRALPLQAVLGPPLLVQHPSPRLSCPPPHPPSPPPCSKGGVRRCPWPAAAASRSRPSQGGEPSARAAALGPGASGWGGSLGPGGGMGCSSQRPASPAPTWVSPLLQPGPNALQPPPAAPRPAPAVFTRGGGRGGAGRGGANHGPRGERALGAAGWGWCGRMARSRRIGASPWSWRAPANRGGWGAQGSSGWGRPANFTVPLSTPVQRSLGFKALTLSP